MYEEHFIYYCFLAKKSQGEYVLFCDKALGNLTYFNLKALSEQFIFILWDLLSDFMNIYSKKDVLGVLWVSLITYKQKESLCDR